MSTHYRFYGMLIKSLTNPLKKSYHYFDSWKSSGKWQESSLRANIYQVAGVHCVTKWQVTKVFTAKWLVTKWPLAKWRVFGQVVQEVYWLKFCWYGVKHYHINKSINQLIKVYGWCQTWLLNSLQYQIFYQSA